MKKISTAHLLLLATVLSQTLIGFLIRFLVNFFKLGNYTIVLFLAQFSLIIPLGIYCLVKKVNILKLIRFKGVNVPTMLLAAFVVIFSYPIVAFLNMVSMFFVENAMTNTMVALSSYNRLIVIFVMAIMPAVIEETLFRGMLYQSYCQRNRLAGVFLSAILFGLMHMNFNQMPYAIYLGIIMAFMLEASDSIVTAMIMHFILNGFSTMATLSQGSEALVSSGDAFDSLFASNDARMQLVGILGVVSLVCLVIVIALVAATFYVNHRSFKKIYFGFGKPQNDQAQMVQDDSQGKVHKNRLLDPWLILFILVTVGYSVYDIIRAAL